MNKKKIAVATALAALVLWTIAPSKSTRANRVLANAFPAKLLAAPSSCTTPEWPAEARRYEVEGITLLHFHINADGGIEDAQVAGSSSWSMLDDAALASLVKCKFKANLDEAERDITVTFDDVAGIDDEPVEKNATRSRRHTGNSACPSEAARPMSAGHRPACPRASRMAAASA